MTDTTVDGSFSHGGNGALGKIIIEVFLLEKSTVSVRKIHLLERAEKYFTSSMRENFLNFYPKS